jgi:ubiquinol-cytochrome c reductase iron-sulfur subunit
MCCAKQAASNRRYEILVSALLGGTIVCAIGFIIAYARGAQTQITAAFLCLACATFAAALIVYERTLMSNADVIEERGQLGTGAEHNEAAAKALLDGAVEIRGSRGWLLRVFAGAAATLTIGLLVPLRSLGPKNAAPAQLGATSWRKGLRLVRQDGSPVRASDLEVNSIETVFPEGFTGAQHTDAMANDATVLVRVPDSEMRLPADRVVGAPEGLLAFSKICTHAGCPVALYRASARQLFCPCHQSTFNVLTGGERVFGPASRGLPQLPIEIQKDGYLAALDGYQEPVGPDYWERA